MESELFNTFDMSPDRHLSYKRSVDLLPPPAGLAQCEEKILRRNDGTKLLKKLVNESFTGCVVISHDVKKTRSALLLFEGRVVGAIYGSKTMPLTQPVEQSMELFKRDVDVEDTRYFNYQLTERVVLPLAALFIGAPVIRSDDLSPFDYWSESIAWCKSRNQTACFAVIDHATCSTLLYFIYSGRYVGAFLVDDRIMIADSEAEEAKITKHILQNRDASTIENSILSSEVVSNTIPMGHDLF